MGKKSNEVKIDEISITEEGTWRSRKKRNAAEEIRKERSLGARLSSKDIPSRLRVTGEGNESAF